MVDRVVFSFSDILCNLNEKGLKAKFRDLERCRAGLWWKPISGLLYLNILSTVVDVRTNSPNKLKFNIFRMFHSVTEFLFVPETICPLKQKLTVEELTHSVLEFRQNPNKAKNYITRNNIFFIQWHCCVCFDKYPQLRCNQQQWSSSDTNKETKHPLIIKTHNSPQLV